MYNVRVKEKKKHFIMWQHLIGICLLLLTGIFSVLFLAVHTVDQEANRIAKAKQVALSRSTMVQIEDTSVFNGQDSYVTVMGEDQEGQKLAVLVAKENHAVYSYPLNKGISQKKASAIVKDKCKDPIERVTFGRYQGKAIWEVKAGSSFYVVDFKTGKVIRVL